MRVGRRVLALPADDIPSQNRGAYLVCVSPGWKRRRRELYLEYGAELDPPLAAEDVAWAEALLKEAGR